MPPTWEAPPRSAGAPYLSPWKSQTREALILPLNGMPGFKRNRMAMSPHATCLRLGNKLVTGLLQVNRPQTKPFRSGNSWGAFGF